MQLLLLVSFNKNSLSYTIPVCPVALLVPSTFVLEQLLPIWRRKREEKWGPKLVVESSDIKFNIYASQWTVGSLWERFIRASYA